MVYFRHIIVNTLHKGDDKDGGDDDGDGGGGDNNRELTITLYHDGILSGNLLRFNCDATEGLERPDLLLPPEPLPPVLLPPV